jgi:hypothetical protein
VAILAWLLIRVLGFSLFEVFVRLHSKLWRQGRVTLAELAAATGPRTGSRGWTATVVERVGWGGVGLPVLRQRHLRDAARTQDVSLAPALAGIETSAKPRLRPVKTPPLIATAGIYTTLRNLWVRCFLFHKPGIQITVGMKRNRGRRDSNLRRFDGTYWTVLVPAKVPAKAHWMSRFLLIGE